MSRVLPILFNGDMVKAILDGRKTVTRRLAKKVPVETHRIEEIPQPFEGDTKKQFECHWGGYQPDTGGFVDGSCKVNPPYQIGDILYVKEKFEEIEKELPESYDTEIILPAVRDFYPYGKHIKYIPSIFMKKSMARIFLRVTDIRLEKIGDMSIQDMLNEGINRDGIITTDGPIEYRVINRFEELWDSTVREEQYKFASSPWVWVIEFEHCEKPESEVTNE